MVLEKTLESPLDFKDIQLVRSEGNQPWDFFGRNDAKAETPVLWPPHAKSWLIGKNSDAGRDWGQEEKGTTEDEMAGWHHRLDGHESQWTLGVGDGQGGLACCDSWGHKESDMTERLIWLIWSDFQLRCNFWKQNYTEPEKKMNSIYGIRVFKVLLSGNGGQWCLKSREKCGMLYEFPYISMLTGLPGHRIWRQSLSNILSWRDKSGSLRKNSCLEFTYPKGCRGESCTER